MARDEDDYSELINDGDLSKTKDAKWNMFRFQDHILYWINEVAANFYERNYSSAFEALQNVYIDTIGFYEESEREELNKLYEVAHQSYVQYIQYNTTYKSMHQRVKTQSYTPPAQLYNNLIQFRIKIMELLCKHQMLIQTVKKGIAGAGSL
jgi:hypothetical protein